MLTFLHKHNKTGGMTFGHIQFIMLYIISKKNYASFQLLSFFNFVTSLSYCTEESKHYIKPLLFKSHQGFIS